MSTTSSTDICNRSLRLAGIARTIASLTEDSEEARACDAFYEAARDECLESFAWPFARRAGPLDLVAEQPETSSADGTYHWGYSYRVPSPAFLFLGVRSPVGRTLTQSAVPRYRLVADAAGGLIYADEVDAYGEWLEVVEDSTRWSATLVAAMVHLLAYYIIPGLTNGDPNGLAAQRYAVYERRLAEAKVLAASQSVPDSPPESDFITARG